MLKKLLLILICCVNVFANNKDTLVVAEHIGITHGLDPMPLTTANDGNIARQCFSCLMGYNDKNELAPKAAESYTQKDKHTWVFTLRKNGKWSDGRPVTAHDFVYAWRRLVAPGATLGIANPVKYIKNADAIMQKKMSVNSLCVKAVNTYTLEVTTETPINYFPAISAASTLSPVPRHHVSKAGDNWAKVGKLVCNGPYVMTEHIHNHKVVLTKNKHYFDANKVSLQTVVLKEIPSGTTAYNAYKNDEVDVSYIEAANLSAISKALPNDVKYFPTFIMRYAQFNTISPAMKDLNVRKALAMSVDSDSLAKILGSFPAKGLAPTNIPGISKHRYHYEWENWTMDKRKAAAKQLLKNVKWKKPLVVCYPQTPAVNISMEVFVNTLKELKIPVVVKTMEWKVYLDAIYKSTHEFDVMSAGWAADYDDASNFISLYDDQGHANLATHYAGGEMFNQMLEEFQDLSHADRMAAMEKRIMEDYPFVTFAQGQARFLQKPHVRLVCDTHATMMFEYCQKS